MDKETSLLPENRPHAEAVASRIRGLRPSVSVSLGFLTTSGKFLVFFLVATEPLWMGAAAIWVNIAYLLQLGEGFIWLGLGTLFTPFLFRLCRGGYAAVRTPFDLPLILLIAGGIIGLWVSPDRGLSWGAFYSILANTLGYWSVVRYRYPGTFLKVGLPLGALALLLATLFAFGGGTYINDSLLWTSSWGTWLSQHLPRLPQSANQPNLTIGASHGLALLLLIAAAMCASVAAFGKRVWLRLSTGLGSLLFLGLVFLIANASLARLFTWGESMDGRVSLWQRTLDLLRDSPLTGAGLGMFASLYNSGVVPPSDATHPHNSYLQLYFDTGVLGVLALLISLVIGSRLCWQILRASRSSPWYGLGVGIVLALLATTLVGIVESAPFGIPVVGTEAYFYIVSPIPWLLAIIMVLTYRLLKKQGEQESGDH